MAPGSAGNGPVDGPVDLSHIPRSGDVKLRVRDDLFDHRCHPRHRRVLPKTRFTVALVMTPRTTGPHFAAEVVSVTKSGGCIIVAASITVFTDMVHGFLLTMFMCTT